MTLPLARLEHLAAIRVRGADRVALLQGQTSNDARKVNGSHAQLTSFSNPKGRCFAVAVLADAGDALVLITEAAVAPALAKRLSMYVLRSDAKVELATELAIGGRPAAGAAPWSTRREGSALAIVLPGARELVLAPAIVGADGSVAWRLADIENGIPTVLPETAEHWVPLWMGLARLEAIDFKKGCYTGQEIVARTHYLGTAKQQLHRASCAVAAAPGAKLFAGGDQPIGEVMVSAPTRAGHALLAVARDVPAGTTVTLGAIDGPALEGLAPVA